MEILDDLRHFTQMIQDLNPHCHPAHPQHALNNIVETIVESPKGSNLMIALIKIA